MNSVLILAKWSTVHAASMFAAALALANTQFAASDASAALAILQKHCASCHGESAMSGLDLRSRETLLKGGGRGPAVVSGNKESSLLYRAVLRNGELQMPPGKQGLSETDIRTIGEWIDQGALWDSAAASQTQEPSWWSFRKPKRPPVPAVKHPEWVRNPIDAFVLATLESKGLKAAPQASKQTLVRRAFFDLHGLPPTLQQMDEFLKDLSPNAYEGLIDRLLASPRYGERWGRHWLDVARYADSGGFENDLHYENAWRYRDYVIQSLNADKPYNEFVQEQIAGDEVWPDNLDLDGVYELAPEKKKHLEARIATGFYTVGSWFPAAGLIPDYLRAERLGDMVDATGPAFMGLTFGCAKCHDHKFDPIPQRDYYRLQAIFAASEEQQIPTVDIMKVIDYQKHLPRVLVMDDLKAAVQRISAQARARIVAEVEKSLPAEVVEAQKTPTEQRNPRQVLLAVEYSRRVAPVRKMSDEELLERFSTGEQQERDRLLRAIGEAYLPFPGRHPTANVLGHAERIPEIHIAIRGDWKNKGEKVSPGLPSSLGGRDLEDPAKPPFITHRRKDLALWLTKLDHPLTARVMVNRLWQGHFGWGIVRTSNDFGRQGELPTHPELLDWLATEFVARGWSMKAIHKLIMLSNVYQLSNQSDEANARVDPDNRLLWRMNRRRLEAEAVRDAILASAGTLNERMFGPPVAPPLSPEEMSGIKDTYKWPVTIDPAQAARRSVYLYIKRAFRLPLFELFDAPDATFSCARRETTNVAPQALALLNNSFVFNQARSFAERLARECGQNPNAWVEQGWRTALGRQPSEAERQRALQMLAEKPETVASGATASARTKFSLTLFNLNEFLYVD